MSSQSSKKIHEMAKQQHIKYRPPDGACKCCKCSRVLVPTKNTPAVTKNESPTKICNCSTNSISGQPNSISGQPKYRTFTKPVVPTTLNSKGLTEDIEVPTKDNSDNRYPVQPPGYAFKVNPAQIVSMHQEARDDIDLVCECAGSEDTTTIWTVKIMKDASISTDATLHNFPAQVQTSLTTIINAGKLEMLLPKCNRYPEQDCIGDVECTPKCKYLQATTARIPEDTPKGYPEREYENRPKAYQENMQAPQGQPMQYYQRQVLPQQERRSKETSVEFIQPYQARTQEKPIQTSYGVLVDKAVQTYHHPDQPYPYDQSPYEKPSQQSVRSQEEEQQIPTKKSSSKCCTSTKPRRKQDKHQEQPYHGPKQSCSSGDKPCQPYQKPSQDSLRRHEEEQQVAAKKSSSKSCTSTKSCRRQDKRHTQRETIVYPVKYHQQCQPCEEASQRVRRAPSETSQERMEHQKCPPSCPDGQKRKDSGRSAECEPQHYRNDGDRFYRDESPARRSDSRESRSKGCGKKRSREGVDKEKRENRENRGCGSKRSRDRNTPERGRKKKDKCTIM